jgi:hypothetical protein
VARRRHNIQTPHDRQKLVEDFEQRLRSTREEGDLRSLVERPRSLGWVVHPLSDQADLLAELATAPGNCWSADAYWRYRDNVYFVRFNSSQPPLLALGPYFRLPGIYYRFDKDFRQDIFDIFLPGSVVALADLHHVFQILESIIDGGRIDVERAALEDEDSRWISREGPIVELT